MPTESSFLPDFGQGYTAPDLPISMSASGQIVVLNYTPTGIDPEFIHPEEPINIYIPYINPALPVPPVEDIVFEPVIELVAPPISAFVWAWAKG